jgi:hypothetical protein
MRSMPITQELEAILGVQYDRQPAPANRGGGDPEQTWRSGAKVTNRRTARGHLELLRLMKGQSLHEYISSYVACG